MAAVERLVEWTADARDALGLDVHLADLERMLSSGNGAQRQRRRHDAGERMRRRSTPPSSRRPSATYAESGTALAVPCGEATG